jgi:hypothetical protein
VPFNAVVLDEGAALTKKYTCNFDVNLHDVYWRVLAHVNVVYTSVLYWCIHYCITGVLQHCLTSVLLLYYSTV